MVLRSRVIFFCSRVTFSNQYIRAERVGNRDQQDCLRALSGSTAVLDHGQYDVICGWMGSSTS